MLLNDIIKWLILLLSISIMLRVLTIVFLFIIRCRFPKLKSLADIIRCRYGNHVLKIIRKYEKSDYRARKLNLDIKFLNTCQDNDLCPTFIQYKLSSKRLQNSNAYRQSQRLFIQEEITFKNVGQQKIMSEMDRIKYDLRTVINLIDWTHISKTFLDSNIQTIKRVECIQNYKISELMVRKLQHNPKKIIHNFSSYRLSDTEKLLLCKGLNFALPPKRLRFENYLLPFELLYRDVYDSENKDESLLHLKSKVKDVGLSSYRIYNKKDHRYENLSPEEYDAFINLSSNKSIIIQKADKGNSVVIINRTHYVKEMEKLLSDTNKFVKVEFNPKHKVSKELRHLLDIQSSIKDCLDDLYGNNYL